MKNELSQHVVDTLMEIIPLLKENLLQPKGKGNYKELSRSHSPILFMLGKHGSLPMSEVARRLRFSKPHITMLVDKLACDGLVTRVPGEKDRRIIEIELTPEGKKMIHSLLNDIKENIKQKISSLDQEELESFSGSLVNMKNILAKIDKENK